MRRPLAAACIGALAGRAYARRHDLRDAAERAHSVLLVALLLRSGHLG